MRGPNDIEAYLVFFSTFEELQSRLPATGPMDHASDAATKLYEPPPTPILYLGPGPVI